MTKRFPITVGLLVLLGCGSLWAQGESPASAVPASAVPAKLPIPSAAEQEKQIATLNEIYELDKARSEKETRALVQELMGLAEEAKGKPTDQFVLLRKSMELSSGIGDAPTTLAAIDRIGERFQFDAMVTKGKMLGSIAPKAKTSTAVESFVDAANGYIDEAIEQRRLDYALHIASLVYRTTQTTHGRKFRNDAMARYREVEKLKKDFDKLAEATRAVQANPNDPDANLTVGQIYCFVYGDWKRGLPYLVRGSDVPLAELAARELANPTEWAEQAKVGNGWWDLGKAKKGVEQEKLLARAGMWYRKAKETATGLTKIKIQKRLEELAQMETSEEKSPPGAGKLVTVFLDDMMETSANVYRRLGKHGDVGYGEVKKGTFGGKQLTHALSAHPPSAAKVSTVTYALDGRFYSLSAVAGLWDTGKPDRPLLFRVVGDGKVLWQSMPLQKGGQQACKVSLRGVKTLTLQVHCSNYTCAHAIWVNPQVTGREAPAPKSVSRARLKPGLQGEVYDGMNFEKKLGKLISPQIAYRWGKGYNPRPSKGPFSIRWTGWIVAPRAGTYTLRLVSDDGCRLYVDDRVVINAWRRQSGIGHNATVRLTGKPQKLKVEYFESTADAHITFYWSSGEGEPQRVPPGALWHSP